VAQEVVIEDVGAAVLLDVGENVAPHVQRGLLTPCLLGGRHQLEEIVGLEARGVMLTSPLCALAGSSEAGQPMAAKKIDEVKQKVLKEMKEQMPISYARAVGGI